MSTGLERLMSQLTLSHEPKKPTTEAGNIHDIPASPPTKLPITFCTKLAQETISDEAWTAASTILIYQRHQHRGIETTRTAIKKDLERGFTLRSNEIPQLLANHRFFASCSSDLAQCVSVKAWTHSFAKDVLPEKLFYDTWLTSFYFEYEDIASLGRLPTLSTQAFADLSLLCRIMRSNRHAREFGCTPRNKYGLFEDYRSSGFFSISVCADVVLGSDCGSYDVNPALYLKMITQLRAMCSSLDGEFLPRLTDFMLDYPKMTTAELAAKYDLDRGAEYVAWARLELEWDEERLVHIVSV